MTKYLRVEGWAYANACEKIERLTRQLTFL